ncbi:MAG TPA: acyl-CoA synthetase FdrA [Bacteroidota bacterium]|nr:acyl-CoA synthetase FdrA [Bacteroidota bacterium]
MTVSGVLRRGEYYDSVTMMLIAKRVGAVAGVADSAVVMGTPGNKSMLASSGLMTPELAPAADTDLVVAFRLNGAVPLQDVRAGIDGVFRELRSSKNAGSVTAQSLEGAIGILPGANFALISVAGAYAAPVAMDALRRGLHVMLFSDNVPVSREISLKTFARDSGLFVMGPDCGTAIIGGVPLGFANVVSRGPVGIVAASGTGLQEVSSLISNAGSGISQAIGTGGRDVKKEVGGIMFLEGMKALAADPATAVLLLVAKPPDEEVVKKIVAAARGTEKPVVAVILGASPEMFAGSGIRQTSTLEEAALFAAAFARGEDPSAVADRLQKRNMEIARRAAGETAGLAPSQKYLRGLFSGGTFCDEAQLICSALPGGVCSNVPFGVSRRLKDHSKSEAHTVIDFGDDEFTVGRPHPMIDYTTRNERILREAEDPACAVLLLDIVLGYGSNPDPLAGILPVIGDARSAAVRSGRRLPVVCSVTGTDRDPQNRSAVAGALQAEGVLVMESNAAACRLAAGIAARKGK